MLFLFLAVGLLAFSAAFAGAEAALFRCSALPPAQCPPRVRRLLDDSVGVLTLILLGNLVVNLSYFAVLALWSRDFSGWTAASANVGGIAVLVLIGEILPKVLGQHAPRLGVRWFLPSVALLHGLFGAPARALGRRFVGPPQPAPALDSAEAEALVGAAAADALSAEEQRLLRQVLELGRLRAGSLRRPLAAAECVPEWLPLPQARRRLLEAGRSVGAVLDAAGEVRGYLDLARVLQGEHAGAAARPVPVLPELAPVAQGVTLLRRSGAPFVLLVDEYGQTAGIIERGRWADTLLDRLPHPSAGRWPAILPLGSGRFRVDAALPLHEFRDRFGDPGPLPASVDTVAGLVQTALGRVPRAGERVHLGRFYRGLDLVVTRADATRVLELEVRPTPANNGTPYTHPRAGTE